ncbi:transmembrane channel-like protein 6 isoform X10 [Phocoena sinus]|uniref:transmembrane channel-like protein 6 isoform X10 n=1 Tax=Phocoena sinus TaxID=42100 RepID=UPI0013C47806|nr:transmembrane channel-like protein 6 isoform X10 [Phocoena sinus]
MSRSLAFVLNVPETPQDPEDSQEPSPYDESEVHDSFHQLIQEQSRWVAEEGLELQHRALGAGALGASGSDHQALLGPEGAPVYSTATLHILASMPSRTIAASTGRSRGAIISQYYSRTVRLRRRAGRPQLRDVGRSARPSLRLYDLELDPAVLEEDEKQGLLVKELQGLTVAQRDHILRGMPLSLAEKRCLREESRPPRGKRRAQGRHGLLSCCSRLRDSCILASHNLGLALLSGLQALMPWHYALKRIGGQFGSSVLSYFLFLKTLLAFNTLLLLPLLAFIVAVQAAFPPAPSGSAPAFRGLELLTGGGCFTHTVMYYGYYSNATLNQPCASPLDGCQCTPEAGGLPYNMPLAYLFTVGVAFFITCITLVYSMSRSFGESYRVGSTSGVHAITVFCSWDYKVTQKWASRLQHDNIRTQLKELLAEGQLRQRPRRACGRLQQAAVLGLVWLLCLGTTLVCALAVYTFSELVIQQSRVSAERDGALLALPLVVCLLNLGAPYLFRVLAVLERHDSPVLEVYVAICSLCTPSPLFPQEPHPQGGHPGDSLLPLAGPQGGHPEGPVLGGLCGPGAVPAHGDGLHLHAAGHASGGAGVEVRPQGRVPALTSWAPGLPLWKGSWHPHLCGGGEGHSGGSQASENQDLTPDWGHKSLPMTALL